MENASASSQHYPKQPSGNSKIVGRASVQRESEAIVHGKFSGISLTNDIILFTWPTTYPNLLYLKGAHKSTLGLHCSIFSLLMFPGIGCYHHLQCLHTNLLVLPQCRAAISTAYLNMKAVSCATAESHQTDKGFGEVWQLGHSLQFSAWLVSHRVFTVTLQTDVAVCPQGLCLTF